jgi:CheY-like chemotaxis protein
MSLRPTSALNVSWETLAVFADSRFAFVGFTPEEAEAVAAVLGEAGGLSRTFPIDLDPLAAEIERSTAVILNVTLDVAQTPWIEAQSLLALKPPLVAVGSLDVLMNLVAIQSRAYEVLVRPFSNGEFVFRIWRCLTRAAITTDSRGNASHKRRILVADDDPSISALTTGLLRGRGFECHEARNGRQALELARTLLPELLILDVNMPLMNGLDVLRALREDPSTAALKVLLFTGSDSPNQVKSGLDLGASGYLRKPFRPFDFLRRVKEILPDLPVPPGKSNTGESP